METLNGCLNENSSSVKTEYQMTKCLPWCDPLKWAIAYVSTQTLLMLKKELVYGLGQGPRQRHCEFNVFVSIEFCNAAIFHNYPRRDASRVLWISNL
jgi:hypothetical protein